MIQSLKSKKTKQLFEGKRIAQFQAFARQAQKRLRVLDAADTLEALRMLPSNRLKALEGSRKGQYSIRINDQWRICFKWRAGDAYDFEITDYH